MIDSNQTPPWVEIAPESPYSICWRMGGGEDYMHKTFLPFWKTLTPVEKKTYVDHWGASVEWREWLELGDDSIDLGKKPGSLLEAVHYENFDEAKRFVNEGADVHVRGEFESTALHDAAGNGSLDIVRLLLQHGAEVDALDMFGRSPLFEAALWGGSLETVKILVEKGADVELKDRDGATPIFNARTLDMTIYLIEKGASIEGCNNSGHNLLHAALDIDQIKYFIKKGLDLHAIDNSGQTPLFQWAFCGDDSGALDCLKTLIDNGAAVNVTDEYGHTPLDYAILHEYESRAEFLRQNGAKDNAD